MLPPAGSVIVTDAAGPVYGDGGVNTSDGNIKPIPAEAIALSANGGAQAIATKGNCRDEKDKGPV
jgi:hypothetical protein